MTRCEMICKNGRHCRNQAFFKARWKYGDSIQTGWACGTHWNALRKAGCKPAAIAQADGQPVQPATRWN